MFPYRKKGEGVLNIHERDESKTFLVHDKGIRYGSPARSSVRQLPTGKLM